jgi:hypothetical protein
MSAVDILNEALEVKRIMDDLIMYEEVDTSMEYDEWRDQQDFEASNDL